MERIDEPSVYFALRKMRVRYLSNDAVRAVKIFIALRQLGMTIVPTSTFAYFYGTTRSNAIMLLHRLGDKGVLMLVKNDKPGTTRYILSEKFVALWSSPRQV